MSEKSQGLGSAGM